MSKKIDYTGYVYMEKVREEDYYALCESIKKFRDNQELSHEAYQKLLDSIMDNMILCYEMKLIDVVMDNIQYKLNLRRGFIKNESE